MSSIFGTVGPSLRRRVWHNVRGVMDIFHLLPPAAAGIIFLLLAFDDQVHELYSSYLESPDFLQIACAVAGFALVSAALYAGHYLLSIIRTNIVFANFLRPNIGNSLRWVRWFFGLLWASAPWLGLLVGLALATKQVSDDQTRLNGAFRVLGEGAPELTAGIFNWALVAGFGIIVAGAAAVLLLLNSFKQSRALLITFAVFIGVLLVVAAVVPVLNGDVVWLYRSIGPLATLSIEVLFLLAIFVAIAFLSQKSKFPAVTLVVAVIALGGMFKVPFSELTFWFGCVCAVFLVLAILSGLWWEAGVVALLGALFFAACYRDATSIAKHDPNVDGAAISASAPAAPDATVWKSFQTWLGKRKDEAGPAKKPYPVFIIAAQGGGIYAATEASLFLARLQDSVPCFADHVFAISGVSGGAIGASIFQALAEKPSGRDAVAGPGKCGPVGHGTPPLSPIVEKIMQGDHFSPIVGAIVPDLLGEQWGRAETLERSFLNSVATQDETAASSLRGWYINHWQAGENTALVLNTTSAETGYRVALAPFGRNDTGDRSFYVLADKQFTAEADKVRLKQECPKNSPALAAKPGAVSTGENVLLMFAAVASARFPFMLPPYSMTSKCGYRLNFVDGGYADNSGATTAFDLYRALTTGAGAGGDQKDRAPHAIATGVDRHPSADIRIILITSDNPLPDFQQINGTKFGDTLAPINALLKVREGLGDQAVARVCDFFKQAKNVDDNCNTLEAAPWQLKLVRLEEQAYGLPLGWKISSATVTLISSLIGSSDRCRKKRALFARMIGAATTPDDAGNPDSSGDDTKAVQDREKAIDIMSNSCVLSDIEAALGEFHQ